METKDAYGTRTDVGKGVVGMDEERTRRMDEERKRRHEERMRRSRIASLMARVDAGERDALGELRERLAGDIEDLVGRGKRDLAVAARDWFRSRIEDVQRAEEYAEREDDAEAPARWVGLRVRVTHIAGAGLTRPLQVVGRLAGVTQRRGLHLLMDELEEEGMRGSPEAGIIVRRVKTERLICWPAVLTVQPLPVREVYAIEENVGAHEAAVVEERQSCDGERI